MQRERVRLDGVMARAEEERAAAEAARVRADELAREAAERVPAHSRSRRVTTLPAGTWMAWS